MTNEDILIKAIKKSIENGWHGKWEGFDLGKYDSKILFRKDNPYSPLAKKNCYFAIIFSHSFAKAFWGDKGIGVFKACLCGEKPKEVKEWQMHLQMMVLEEEPLKYLEKFL